MPEKLNAAFTKEQIELALAIGQQEGDVREKIVEVFTQLDDPLLSIVDVRTLLGGHDAETKIAELLEALVKDGELEKSTTTTRPLDDEGIALFRKAGVPFVRLKLVAMESKLANSRTRYQFTCDARLIRSLARIDRLDAVAGTGQQRDEIVSHVKKIAAGIASGVQIPNPVLIVLLEKQIALPDDGDDAPKSFIHVRHLGEYERVMSPFDEGDIVEEYRPVVLDFPYRRAAFDEEKSALLVDGQQRTAAISQVDRDQVPKLMISVNAEIASEEDARKIFVVANSTEKIKTQFSRALLASMEDAPGYLSVEKPRANAARKLILEDPDSPFFQIVQYPGAKTKNKFIVYNSLFQVVTTFAESSLAPESEPAKEKTIYTLVKRCFSMAKELWPTAWNVKATESRLMHGVGLRAMSIFFVYKLEGLIQHYGDLESDELWEELAASMKRLQPQLVWRFEDTEHALKNTVKFFQDEIRTRQNTFQDITELSRKIKQLSLEVDNAVKPRKGKGKKSSKEELGKEAEPKRDTSKEGGEG